MKPPFFWHRPNMIGTLLNPLGVLYDMGVGLHQRLRTSHSMPLPAICVGNLVLGGAGKTPVCIALGNYLKNLGHTPHFILRGYGRRQEGTFGVDLRVHSVLDVGDEALLLAQEAPTWVAECRLTAAKKAADAGASIVILDDGFQDTSFQRQMNILVLDRHYGIGNGRVFPAGPLRESPARALSRATHLIDLVTSSHQNTPALLEGFLSQEGKNLPRWEGERKLQWTTPVTPAPVIAFAGIGNPHQFFDALRHSGLDLKATQIFPDHYCYTDADLRHLMDMGVQTGASLITTQKDLIRIPVALRQHFQTPALKIHFFQESEIIQTLRGIFGATSSLPSGSVLLP